MSQKLKTDHKTTNALKWRHIFSSKSVYYFISSYYTVIIYKGATISLVERLRNFAVQIKSLKV